MANVLSLFPARIAIVDQNGVMTPEFFRALSAIYIRVGGAIGDNGQDTYTITSQSSSSGNDTASFSDVIQPFGDC
tara:strand:- start:399 stop:623 length:225 start_codon:yes stop_codon:yes gene_type:complete